MAFPNKPALNLADELDRSPSFPKGRHLIVTTSTGVYSWNSAGVAVLFCSHTRGIIAATKAGNMLAIADGRVVVLHDMDKGMQKRNYRLKGSDGQVGLLQYASNSAKLYFTTTLQHGVQSYSLDHLELQDATQSHPSPPNVLAVSPSSHRLLSASSKPPIVYLTNIARYSPPFLLQPGCSASAAVAAAFHPEIDDIFALAFADGTVAVYDAACLHPKTRTSSHGESSASSDHKVEIGYITKVHATVNQIQSADGEEGDAAFHGYDPSTGTVGIGNAALGIMAIAFVPGLKATVMTVGADGKCCVIDFAVSKRQSSSSSKIRIANSWHLGTSATSLALCLADRPHAPSHSMRGRHTSHPTNYNRVLAAIGLGNAKVVIYDLKGNLEGQHSFDSTTPLVQTVGVEWATTESRLAGRTVRRDVIINPNSHATSDPRSTTSSSSSRETSRAAARQYPELSTSALNRLGLLSSIRVVEPTVVSESGTHRPTLGHMDLFQPVPTAVSDSTEYQTAKEDLDSSTSLPQGTKETERERKRRGVIGTDGMNEESSQSTIVKTSQVPSIPPRPNPRPGGRLYLRRAQTSGTSLAGAHHVGSSKHSKSMGVMKSSTNKRASKVMSPDRATTRSIEVPGEPYAGPWVDISPNPADKDQESSSNKENPRAAAVLSPTSHLSEGSNDTVVDWSTNTSLPPAPTMNITRTTTLEVETSKRPSSPSKPKRPAPASFDPTQGSKSDDTVVQWSSLKKSPRVFDILNDLQVDAKPAPEATNVVRPPPLPDRVVRNPGAKPLSETNANATKAPNLPPRTSQPTVPLHASSSKHTTTPPHFPNAQHTPQVNPRSTSQQSDPHHDPHDLGHVLQHYLHRELKLFHREMMHQFEMQRAWFQNETRDKDLWIEKLEEENGRLRHELGRMRRR
ncbi:isoleucine--tRNA ligase [Physcia stellaris]|nr:isoleucine--tRNA ligase [Physcia stellaris]